MKSDGLFLNDWGWRTAAAIFVIRYPQVRIESIEDVLRFPSDAFHSGESCIQLWIGKRDDRGGLQNHR